MLARHCKHAVGYRDAAPSLSRQHSSCQGIKQGVAELDWRRCRGGDCAAPEAPHGCKRSSKRRAEEGKGAWPPALPSR